MRSLIHILFFGFIFAQNTFAFDPFNSKPYLTPTSSPTNSIYINWNTENQESTIVAYGLTTSLEDTVRSTSVRNYHHAMLTDLLPSTEYYYRVLPDGDMKTFKAFSSQTGSLTFVAFGDTRSDSAAHQSVINRMAAYEFDFFMHSGDLVGQGDSTSDWKIFFNVEDTLLQSKQFLPTIGGHEFRFWPYDTLFALPEPEAYYSIDYGNAHFIMLDTEMDLYGVQRDWLINDLISANSDTSMDWIFVNLHRPPYSSSSHGSQLDVRDAWCPLFETYGVDIVFGGHDHDYERTVPINGVVYLVTGGCGAPLYPAGSNSWTAYSEMTYHFCLINIMVKKLLLKAIKPDGTIFDSLIIDKITGIEKQQVNVPTQCIFNIGYPNPFRNSTRINYSIPSRTEVHLDIYDVSGRLVRRLVNGIQKSGSYSMVWDGTDDLKRKLVAGTYFVKFTIDPVETAREFTETRKLLLIK